MERIAIRVDNLCRYFGRRKRFQVSKRHFRKRQGLSQNKHLHRRVKYGSIRLNVLLAI